MLEELLVKAQLSPRGSTFTIHVRWKPNRKSRLVPTFSLTTCDFLKLLS